MASDCAGPAGAGGLGMGARLLGAGPVLFSWSPGWGRGAWEPGVGWDEALPMGVESPWKTWGPRGPAGHLLLGGVSLPVLSVLLTCSASC